jgi:hypothetical protein
VFQISNLEGFENSLKTFKEAGSTDQSAHGLLTVPRRSPVLCAHVTHLVTPVAAHHRLDHRHRSLTTPRAATLIPSRVGC